LPAGGRLSRMGDQAKIDALKKEISVREIELGALGIV
jgi:hypothetical protein